MTKNFMTGELIKVLPLVVASTASIEQCRNRESVAMAGNSRQKRIVSDGYSYPETKLKGKCS